MERFNKVALVLASVCLRGVCGLTCFNCFTNGPASPAQQPDWLAKLKHDRNATLSRIGYDGGVFDLPELKWTQTSYVQPQMHPYDRFFYDPVTGNYTVQKYLDDLRSRYGGIDSILLWPTYTNLGADDRNQFDLFRAMPGGLEAVKKITSELKASGVRVMWPYNPWDLGTRREKHSDEEMYASLLKQTGGDGFNGDTMGYVPESFWQAASAHKYPVAFEPELGGSDKALNWTTMGWGYWFSNTGPKVPQVDRRKFVTSGKFLTHICDRWAKSKKDHIQSAWFNGVGIESWENVWGSWNGMVPQDGEALRRAATMLRFFGKKGYLQSPEWEPHVLDVVQQGVYASRWPVEGSVLWTIINRAGKDLSGAQLRVDGSHGHYYDCYHGRKLQPLGDQLSFALEDGGFGCVLQTNKPALTEFSKFFATMSKLTVKPLASYDATWRYLPQKMVDIPRTKKVTKPPLGMVYVPKGNFTFQTSGVEIEGDDAHGVDVQFGWEEQPQRTHNHTMDIGPFFIDKFPVTTTNYSRYLNATGYVPKDTYNWLKNWNGKRIPPANLSDVPVTYVGLEEARKYCAWANGGSRLPHSYEWQYAAQGTDGRTFPWGNLKRQARFPKLHRKNVIPGAEPVTRYTPDADSPFAVSDLVGNVWQYTDEFQDTHTRAVILKGGSNYYARCTNATKGFPLPGCVPGILDWYFTDAIKLTKHQKYFLMDDRYERAGTIGFRCVVDAATEVDATTEVYV